MEKNKVENMNDENTAQPVSQNELVKSLVISGYPYRHWLIWLSLIMYGWSMLLTVSVIGVIVAWLPLLAGLRLHQVHSDLEKIYLTGNAKLMAASQFKILRAIAMITITFMILSFIAVIKIVMLFF